MKLTTEEQALIERRRRRRSRAARSRMKLIAHGSRKAGREYSSGVIFALVYSRAAARSLVAAHKDSDDIALSDIETEPEVVRSPKGGGD